jgi:PhoPQ-activated pathogenicity-related protein
MSSVLALCGLVVQLQGAAPSHALDAYIRKADGSTSFRVLKSSPVQSELELTSQTWKGSPWKHGLLYQNVAAPVAQGTAILFITGDGPFDGDRVQLSFMSGASGLPIAMLFGVPNQPLYGKREDDLIVYTLLQYLADGNPDWPLLFPMVKSAIRAMDAIQSFTRDSANPIKRFVVTGASKRGWTTWLVGASQDRRVVGLAPMVIDFLNFSKQNQHQMATFGKYSEMIEAYSSTGLVGQMQDPKMPLIKMLDPFAYRSRITVPTLIVTGSNDRYWNSDATSLYWDDLKMPKWNRVVPNVGHDLGGGLAAIETISAFAQSIAAKERLPELRWKLGAGPGNISATVTVRKEAPDSISLWRAESPTLDFRDAKYNVAAVLKVDFTPKAPSTGTLIVARDANKNTAVFVEFRFRRGGKAFSFTSPVQVFPKNR